MSESQNISTEVANLVGTWKEIDQHNLDMGCKNNSFFVAIPILYLVAWRKTILIRGTFSSKFLVKRQLFLFCLSNI